MRDVFPLGVTGLAIMAVVLMVRPSNPPRQSTSPQTETRDTVPATGAPAEHRVGSALLEEFLGTELTNSAPRCTTDFDVVIFSVPDPNASSLDWVYDSYIESIQRAFETAGFVSDRFRLPAVGRTLDAADSSATSLPGTPAAMLFRRGGSDGCPDLRLGYIVGEVPTVGVDRKALETALEEREHLVRDSAALSVAQPRRIRLVGPAFSGSALSLRASLEDWLQDRTDTVEIVTGSATSDANIDHLRRGAIRFHATANPDGAFQAVLGEVLGDLGIGPDQVALLQESSTAYGQSVTSGYVTIPFPIGIGSLRGAYASSPEERSEEVIPGTERTARVPLDLQVRARPLETPLTASRLTAPTLDLILEEIVHTLEHKEIRAVGLMATDVRDKLFLASLVRDEYPDVQLFTFESNKLLLRADHNRALHGTLVFSTYPLLLESQWWTGRSGSRIPFPNDGAQGVYNATLVQLNADTLVGYRPLVADSAVQPGWQRPPVWITAVGRRTMVPLAQKARSRHAGIYTMRGASADRPLADTWSPGVLSIVLSFVALILIACSAVPAWRAWWLGPGRGRKRDMELPGKVELEALSRDPCYGALRERESTGVMLEHQERRERCERVVKRGSLILHGEIYNGLLTLSFLGLAAPPLFVTWVPYLMEPPVFLVAFLTTAVIALVPSVFVASRVLLRYRRPAWRHAFHDQKGIPRAFWILEMTLRAGVVVAGLVYAVLTTVYLFDLAGLNAVEQRLFSYRSLQLDSGLSPTLPLTIAGIGFAVWCIWHLRRVRCLWETTSFEEDCLARTDTYPGCDDPSTEGRGGTARSLKALWTDALDRASEAACRVRDRLFMLIPDPWALVIGAFMAAGALMLWTRFTPTIEALVIRDRSWLENVLGGTTFDLLFPFVILALVVGLSWAVVRLLLVWFAMRDCLAALAETPLLPAFERVPDAVAQGARLTLIQPPRENRDRVAVMSLWTRLLDVWKTDLEPKAPEQSKQVEELMGSGNDWLMGLEAWPRDREKTFGTLRSVLTDLWSAGLRYEPPGTKRDETSKADGGKNPEPKEEAGTAAAQSETKRAAGKALKAKGQAGTVSEKPDKKKAGRKPDPHLVKWLGLAEEVAAVEVVRYIKWVLSHIRRLSLFLVASMLVTTALLSSYPFQPQATVKLVFMVVLLSAVAALWLVANQISRDEIMSRITHTPVGQAGWSGSHLLNLAAFVAAPLLTILATEFPGLQRILFAWVAPLLRSLTHV